MKHVQCLALAWVSFFCLGASSQSISTNLSSGSYCPGGQVSIPFTATGTFNAGNVFTAQLSDAAGSFATPVSVGALTATASGSISGTIPAGTTGGTGYLIRVVGSNPVVTGSSSAALSVGATAQVSSQTLCANASTTAVSFGTGSTAYTWTNNNTSIGLASSGAGNIPSFTTLNATAAPKIATITYTRPASAAVDIAYLPGALGDMRIINLTTRQTIGTVAISGSPYGIALSADGSEAFVSSLWPRTISRVNLATRAETASYFLTGIEPLGVVAAPAGDYLYVSSNGSLQKLNLSTGEFTSMGGGGTGVALRPGGTEIWAVQNGNIGIISMTTHAVTQTINVGIGLGCIAFNQDGTRAYVTGTSGSLRVYNTATRALISTLSFGSNTYALGVAATPDGSRVVVTDESNARIYIVNTATNAVVYTVAGFADAYAVSISSDGLRAYVTSWSDENLRIVNIATGAQETPISLPGGAFALTNFIRNQPAYCASSGNFSITVNVGPTMDVVTAKSVCAGSTLASVPLTGNASTSFTWTNSNPAIGLAASGSGDLPAFTAINATGAPVTATITVTATSGLAGACGSLQRTFTITVNPVPVLADMSSQSLCPGNTSAASFSASPTSTYTWTNTNTSIGLPASGTTSSIGFTAQNSSDTAALATVTVTPNYGGLCSGTAKTFSITVNPGPRVNTVADRVYCQGSIVPALTLTGSPATVFTWTNSNTTTGLAASGTGSIPSFTAQNSGVSSLYGVVVVTATFASGGCPTTSKGHALTVNPAQSSASVANDTLCAGTLRSTTNLGTSGYSWTNSDPTIGLAASGTGNIPSFTGLNTTTAARTATIAYTRTATTSTDVAYLPGAQAGVLRIIDLGTRQVAGTVNVGGNGYGIAFSPGGSTAFVSNLYTRIISQVNLTTRAVARTYTFPFVSDPLAMGVSPLGDYLYVNSDSALMKLNVSTGAYTALGSGGTGVALRPGGSELWAAQGFGIGIASMSTHTVVETFNTGPRPICIAFSADGSVAYVTARSGSVGTLLVYNASTRTLISSLSFGSGSSVVGVAVTPDGSRVVVADEDNGRVYVVNAQTNTLTYTVNGLDSPYAVSTSSDGVHAYVTSWNDPTLRMVNLYSGVQETPISLPEPVFGLTNFVLNSGAYACPDAGSFTITVRPLGTAPGLLNKSAAGTVCQQNNVILTQTGGTLVQGSYWQWCTDAALTQPVGGQLSAVNAQLTVSPGSTTSYYLHAEGNPCQAAPPATGPITIDVYPASAPGTATGSQSICSGATPAALSLSGYTGSILKWQSATDAAFTQNIQDIATSSATLSPAQLGALPQTRHYRAVVSSGGCSTVYSNAVTITVNSVPASFSLEGAGTYCDGQGRELRIPDAQSGIAYQLYRNGQLLGSPLAGTGVPLSFHIQGAGSYTALATNEWSCSASLAGPAVIVDLGLFSAQIGAAQNMICTPGASTMIHITGGPSGGTATILENGQNPQVVQLDGAGSYTFSTGALTTNATYTIAGVSNGVCTTPTSISTTIYVGTLIADANPNSTTCAGAVVGPVAFTGNFPAGTQYSWVASNGTSVGMAANAGSGTSLPAFTAFNSGSTTLFSDVTFTPIIEAEGCKLGARTFRISVQPAPVIQALTSQVLCAGSMTTPVSFFSPTPGAVFTWTNSDPSIGISASGGGAIPAFIARSSTAAQATVATIRATAHAMGCAGLPAVFTYTVNSAAGSISYAGSPFCQTGTVNPVHAGTRGGIFSSGAGLALNPSTGQINLGQSMPGTYIVTYTVAASGGCSSTTTASITINEQAFVNTIGNQVYCNNMVTAPVPFSGNAPSYSWANTNPGIGLTASGTGTSLPSFTTVNAGPGVQYAYVRVTPQGNGSTTCAGRGFTFRIAVNYCGPVAGHGDTGGDGGTARMQQSFQVSPNPATGSVVLQYTGSAGGPFTVQLVSQYGTPIGKAGIMNGTARTLDLSNITPGSYLLKVTHVKTGISFNKQVIKL
ncbi:MAG: hypothetical protein EOO15_10260 [Chitinophagaceae bacterium]|nr:MAG: hypothetical protein EOO15_10260 [Chitinophagaceae bacterium]